MTKIISILVVLTFFTCAFGAFSNVRAGSEAAGSLGATLQVQAVSDTCLQWSQPNNQTKSCLDSLAAIYATYNSVVNATNVASYCSSCTPILSTFLINGGQACLSADDAATLKATASRAALHPLVCATAESTMCFPQLKSLVAQIGNTAATQTGMIAACNNTCNRELLSALQMVDQNKVAPNAAAAFCLRTDPKNYCLPIVQSMANEFKVKALCQPCVKKILAVNPSLMPKLATRLGVMCNSNTDGQVCEDFMYGAHNATVAAVKSACPTTFTGACSAACKSALDTLESATGCCFGPIVSFITTAAGELTATSFMRNSCNMTAWSTCGDYEVRNHISVLNQRTQYWVENPVEVRDLIVKDLSYHYGILSQQVAMNISVGRPGYQYEVDYAITSKTADDSGVILDTIKTEGPHIYMPYVHKALFAANGLMEPIIAVRSSNGEPTETIPPSSTGTFVSAVSSSSSTGVNSDAGTLTSSSSGVVGGTSAPTTITPQITPTQDSAASSVQMSMSAFMMVLIAVIVMML